MLSLQEQTTLAERAGFTAASSEMKMLEDRRRRLAIAYEHYPIVRDEQIASFQKRLRAATLVVNNDSYSIVFREQYDKLVFTPTDKYAGMPPDDVLLAVEAAKGREIFDVLEVAHIQTVRIVHDPIVFGTIEGCNDRFFVAQWGSDVSLADLVGQQPAGIGASTST